MSPSSSSPACLPTPSRRSRLETSAVGWRSMRPTQSTSSRSRPRALYAVWKDATMRRSRIDRWFTVISDK